MMRSTLARWEMALLLLAVGCQLAVAPDRSDQLLSSPEMQRASADTDATEGPIGNGQPPPGSLETSMIDSKDQARAVPVVSDGCSTKEMSIQGKKEFRWVG